jgi:hypothetical protein
MGARAPARGLAIADSKRDSDPRRGAGSGNEWCCAERVRKSLIVKGLCGNSFLKNAEGFENEEFNFFAILQKSEKTETEDR